MSVGTEHNHVIVSFFHRKDTQGFFAYPVNDTIAPGYSNIITHPMDFSSMKYKIDSKEYQSMEKFRVRQTTQLESLNTVFTRIINTLTNQV